MSALTRDILAAQSLFTTHIQPQAIPTLENELLMYRFGEPKTIPAQAGDTLQVQIAQSLTSSTTPVHELAGGFANRVNHTTATMRVHFFANDVQESRFADLINEVNWRDSAFGRLVFNAAETGDLLARDVLDDMSTNVQLVNSRASVATLVASDTHSVTEINNMVTTLRVGNAKPHRLTGGKFAHIIHNRNAGDLRGDTGIGSNPNQLTWYDLKRRNDSSAVENARLGATMGTEIFETSAIQRLTNASSVAYYNTFVIGDNLFMTGAIGSLPNAPDSINAGRSLIHMIPPAYTAYTPFGNVWVMSWDFYAGTGLIDDNRGGIIQAASSA